MNTAIEKLENQITQEKARIERAAVYRSTRSHYRQVPASEILHWIRINDSRVNKYAKTNGAYNPEFTPNDEKNWVSQSHHYRWIENIYDAGLRSCGFADEINSRGIDHKGWYADPYGMCDEVYRGIICQLPARKGFPQYVYGYADPCNKDAALLDFDIIEGALGGTEHCDDGELQTVAGYADDMARVFAEREKNYQVKYTAEEQAEEKREEAKEMRSDLCDHIKATRTAIKALLLDAEDLIDNPWQIVE